MSFSTAEALTTLQTQGYPVDAEGVWGPISQNSWWLFTRSASYTAGIVLEDTKVDYEFAYQGVVDQNFAQGVAAGTGYFVVPSVASYGSYASYAVQFALRESGGKADSFDWNFGDSGTATTTVPSAVHVYSGSGTYHAQVTPSVGGHAVATPFGFYASV